LQEQINIVFFAKNAPFAGRKGKIFSQFFSQLKKKLYLCIVK
jgi:hypothetical protein